MRKFFFFILLFSCSHAFALDSNFHPEALPDLEKENGWVKVSFKKGKTGAAAVFRFWIPFKARDVWPVLIDTNAWKDNYGDYTDSRALDRNQYQMVEQRKPGQIKAFYELVGEQVFPSELGRQVGGTWTSYVFQRFNLPWPLADRWLVMKVKNDETRAASGYYRYDYKFTAGNFKELKGYWELVPIPGKPGWTEFRGQYESDPGIEVPHFLTRSLFKSSMQKDVKVNIGILEKKGATKAQ